MLNQKHDLVYYSSQLHKCRYIVGLNNVQGMKLKYASRLNNNNNNNNTDICIAQFRN